MLSRFVIREAFRLLTQRKRLNLVSLAAISLALMALGWLLLLQTGVFSLAEFVEKKVEVVAFLGERMSTAEVDELLARLRAHFLVARVDFRSKEDALKEFAHDPALARFIEALGTNPLPASVRIQLREKTPDNVAAFATWLNEQPGVEESSYGGRDADRLLKFVRLVQLGTILLTLCLILTAVYIIANIISLMVFSRREEISIMRMIGATKWFVRWPYLIWGLIQGVGGGLAASGMMVLIWVVFSYYAWKEVGVDLEALLPPQANEWMVLGMAGLAAAGAVIGLFSSLFSVGRQLRE